MSLNHEERQRLMELTQYKVEVDTGTNYPCKQRRIDGWNHFFSEWRGYDHRAEKVTIHFTRSILEEPSTAQMDAIDHLRNGMRDRNWEPDIIIKAMHDIDVAFFNGKLKGKVTVRWADLNEEQPYKKRYRLGNATYQGDGRSSITLYPHTMFWYPKPKTCMWSTLIHELVVSWAQRKLLERASILLIACEACLDTDELWRRSRLNGSPQWGPGWSWMDVSMVHQPSIFES